jgi:hypothetical protein
MKGRSKEELNEMNAWDVKYCMDRGGRGRRRTGLGESRESVRHG